jgi:hypothetical protein
MKTGWVRHNAVQIGRWQDDTKTEGQDHFKDLGVDRNIIIAC